MVAGKPATNSLLLTNQQTGTVPPGGSMQVSFSFHATSVGRWTHDLAVRNLGNKHDQARWYCVGGWLIWYVSMIYTSTQYFIYFFSNVFFLIVG